MSSAAEVLELSRSFLPNSTGSLTPQGFVIVLQLFMDESGTHDGSPVVAVGAYMGSPKSWANWTQKWNAKKTPIEVFHASEASSLRGEFKGWTVERKNELVANLLPVLGSADDLFSVTVGLRMDDYREALATHPELAEMIGDTPYVACFQWAIQSLLEIMDRNHDAQGVSVVHEINQYQGAATSAFNYVRERNPQRQMTLAFGDKATYPPLQAADILAYESNRHLRDLDAPPRQAWTALNPTGGRREMKYFDKAALIAWANGLRAMRLNQFLSAVR